jgi:hypothetical protein
MKKREAHPVRYIIREAVRQPQRLLLSRDGGWSMFAGPPCHFFLSAARTPPAMNSFGGIS